MPKKKVDPNFSGFRPPPSGKHNKRADFHDYTAPGIYMFTLKKSPAAPDFSRLTGSLSIPAGPGSPGVEHLRLGEILYEELKKTEEKRPGYFRLKNHVIMPDHAHLLVHVLRKLNQPITKIIAMNETMTTNRARSERLIPPDASAFAGDGINDRILYAKGQLDVLYKYIEDNPRRLMMKFTHPNLFRKELGLRIGNIEMNAMGNIFLLRRPLMAVHVRRIWTAAERADYREKCLAFSRQGGVLISPFISPHEKEIRQEALGQGGSVIKIYDRGFTERWKPAGKDFDLCAEGRLLVMVESHRSARPEDMTYQKASGMNRVAEYIAANPQMAMHLLQGR